jgi:xanthine dehydrogenase accessory factor
MFSTTWGGEAFPRKSWTVYAPLGLDIGADSPAEIAVSTIAEVLAVLRQRTAKHLRLGR